MRESELVILLTGAKYKSEAEFDIHVGEARRAGVGWDVIQAIPRGTLLSETDWGNKEQKGSKKSTSVEEEFNLEKVKKPVIPMLEKEHDNGRAKIVASSSNNGKEREVAIVLFTAELLDRNTVCDETYAQTKRVLDGQDSVLVEIMAIIG